MSHKVREMRELPDGRVRATDQYAATFPEQALITAAEYMARVTGVEEHGGKGWRAPGPRESECYYEPDFWAEEPW